jgi:hypothetical protein
MACGPQVVPRSRTVSRPAGPLLANYLRSGQWRAATQVTRSVTVGERRPISGATAVLSCCTGRLALASDHLLVRYASTVGNDRWPGSLPLPCPAEVGPVPAALWSDMVVSLGRTQLGLRSGWCRQLAIGL